MSVTWQPQRDVRLSSGGATVPSALPWYLNSMPKGPRGERRPADFVGAAVKVMRIATGEEAEVVARPEDEGKDPAAVAPGRRGGKAWADSLSKKGRAEIARKAAGKRWAK